MAAVVVEMRVCVLNMGNAMQTRFSLLHCQSAVHRDYVYYCIGELDLVKTFAAYDDW